MADDLHRTAGPYGPVRVRPEELIRPADKRRDFTTREAQRRLQEKERPRWHLVAYAVFLIAAFAICAVTYTTYAFSLYRGVILPGVSVDGRSLSGMTESHADRYLQRLAAAIDVDPVRLVSGGKSWTPSADAIGYHPNPAATAKSAFAVGRSESFVEQLLDRSPLHPDHYIPLTYHLNESALRAYIRRIIADQVTWPSTNASLKVAGNDIVLVRSKAGRVIDLQATTNAVHSALGALSTRTERVRLSSVAPAISDSYALGIRDRVENFLLHPPIIGLGHRVIVMKRQDIAPMLSFRDERSKGKASIVMTVDPTKVQAYISQLASTVDRPATNARFDFSGGHVRVIVPRRLGRTLVQQTAYQQLLNAIKGLVPHARLHFTVLVTKPPIDLSNPASLGINTLLGVGETSFVGAPGVRLDDITAIASRLDDDLLPPNQDVMFNSLVGAGWPSRMYADEERKVNGKLVPGAGGAMQQVATTFFRALFASGLKLQERQAHPYRLGWYEPPAGLDAVVDPGNNEDLIFSNNSGKYLLIKARVEPIRKELYIYVWGPKLGWKVSISENTTKVYPHGSMLVQQDPSLLPGETKQTAWAHDGADTDVTRTVEYPNGNVAVDHVKSHYRPWRAIELVGSNVATPTPKATPGAKGTPTPTPPPKPTPTATFDH